MSSPDPLLDRLTNLELLFTHLERQVGELAQVVLNLQRKVELLDKRSRRMEAASEGSREDLLDGDD